MLFSEVKRNTITMDHNPLKNTCTCSCMIKTTSSVLPRNSSEIFENGGKRLSGLRTTFGESSKIFEKSSKKSLVCYIPLVRYQVEHSKINSHAQPCVYILYLQVRVLALFQLFHNLVPRAFSLTWGKGPRPWERGCHSHWYSVL